MSFTFVHIGNNGFTGRVRSDFPTDLIARTLAYESLQNCVRLLKDDGKSRVSRHVFEDRAGKRWDVVVKRVRYRFLPRRLGFLFFASPASRSLRGALLLQKTGIPTASPLAAVEASRWEGLGTSYYFAETVENGRNLYVAWKELQEQWPAATAIRKQRLLFKELAAFVSRLHASGIYHRDLKGSNILVRTAEREQIEFVLVDIDGVRRSRAFTWRKRVKNLIQISRFRRLSHRDKILFLSEYGRRSGISKKKMRSLVRRIVTSMRSTPPRPSRRRNEAFRENDSSR